MTKVEINRLVDEIVGIKQYHRRLEAINNPDGLMRCVEPKDNMPFDLEVHRGFDYRNWEIESGNRKFMKFENYRF